VNTLSNVQKITFKYPDGAKDAECMLIDQQSKDIYILSKREKISDFIDLLIHSLSPKR